MQRKVTTSYTKAQPKPVPKPGQYDKEILDRNVAQSRAMMKDMKKPRPTLRPADHFLLAKERDLGRKLSPRETCAALKEFQEVCDHSLYVLAEKVQGTKRIQIVSCHDCGYSGRRIKAA
jgi:hypothetical protein